MPQEWSRGIISPILKDVNADPRDPLNYRGITITSLVYKIYCSLLNHRLSHWIESNNILCDEQNGFRSGRCSSMWYTGTTCLLKKKLQITQNKVIRFILGLPSRSHIGPTEFSGASMLPVPLRVDQLKLNHMYNIINGIAPSYLKSKISIAGHTSNVTRSGNRACFVPRVNSFAIKSFFYTGIKQWNALPSTTQLRPLIRGVLQGSILGPLLFNVFTYDIIESSTKFNFIMYADDTTLNSTLKSFGDVTNLESLQHNISTELNNVVRWLDLNKLRLNVLKTKYMLFHMPQKVIPHLSFTIQDNVIDYVNSINFLGITYLTAI